MRLTTVFVILLASSVILTLAFVYSPKEDWATINEIPHDSLIVITPPKNLPEPKLVASDDPNPYMQKVLLDYDDFIGRAVLKGIAPGAAVAIIRDTSIVFLKGFGLKQVGLPDTIDVNTVFRLGSVSKSISSVLAGALVSKHLINWDDPIITYIPQFELKSKEQAEKLTIRHVLSHTTGLPYHAYTNMIEEHLPFDTLMAYLKQVDLFGEPGQYYSYQNVGYSLIGKVVETATHQSFEAALKENIFKPLNMRNGSASYEAIINHDNVAKPHYFSRKHWVTVPISDTYYNTAPAGGINASITDMALWLKALLNGSPILMSDSTLHQIFEPQVKAISKNHNFRKWQRPKASYYALGWRILTFKNDTIEYHGGYVNGYRSEVAIDRKNKLAICVLTNSPGNLSDQAIPEFLKRYAHYADSIDLWQKRNKLILVKNIDPLAPVFLN
ncbi:MAG: beta-lactamase family protein [Cyclobacteriaceae bacterium]|nr:beta-lactamase family protein [Cyclobacteriaceae bacterium]